MLKRNIKKLLLFLPFLFLLLTAFSPAAAAKSIIPANCSSPCSGNGTITWDRTGHSVVRGVTAYLTFSLDTEGDANATFKRFARISDSSGYYVDVGYMLAGDGCGTLGADTLYFYWEDFRPNGGGYAIHCYLMSTYAPNATSGDTFLIADAGVTTPYAYITLGDYSRNQYACNGGGGNCSGTNEATDFELVQIDEGISNWTSNDVLDTTVWYPVEYHNGTAWQTLSSTNSTVSGPNPPWIGYVSGQSQQFYSCSKFATNNPC